MVAQLRAGHRKHAAKAEARKRAITRVFPTPRRVTVGGREFFALEFQLRDLVELQAWLEDDAGHPLDAVPPVEDDPDPATRATRLVAAYHASHRWPPRLGTPEAGRRLASPEGRAFFLTRALGKCQPDFRPRDALALIPEMTAAEWRALRRVAWGWSARDEVMAELDPSHEAGKLLDWAEEANALHEHRGVRYAEMLDLHLCQWRNIRAGGKADRHVANRQPGESQADADARLRALLDLS